MMFPDDDVGMLHAGSCSHTEGKRSLHNFHSLKSLIHIQVKCIINDVTLRHKLTFSYENIKKELHLFIHTVYIYIYI